MKRSEELSPLSRDHHQALFRAMGLKRATDAEPGQRWLAFHDSDGERHFEVEESVLLPAWVAATPDADRALAARVIAEHLELRAAARRLRAGESLAVTELHEIGALLERHVRFEERELFPVIERDLDPEALAALGAEVERAEAGGRPSSGG